MQAAAVVENIDVVRDQKAGPLSGGRDRAEGFSFQGGPERTSWWRCLRGWPCGSCSESFAAEPACSGIQRRWIASGVRSRAERDSQPTGCPEGVRAVRLREATGSGAAEIGAGAGEAGSLPGLAWRWLRCGLIKGLPMRFWRGCGGRLRRSGPRGGRRRRRRRGAGRCRPRRCGSRRRGSASCGCR